MNLLFVGWASRKKLGFCRITFKALLSMKHQVNGSYGGFGVIEQKVNQKLKNSLLFGSVSDLNDVVRVFAKVVAKFAGFTTE